MTGRRTFIREIRRAKTWAAAEAIVEAYEAVLAQDPTELYAVEGLPDWEYDTLLSAAVQRCTLAADASQVLELARRQLIGDLARAVAQAVKLRDHATARAMGLLCDLAAQRLIGESALGLALGGGESKGEA